MNETDMNAAGLRAGLIAAVQAARAAERDVLAALDPDGRDAPAPDGGWSPKDVQAHLNAWKGRTVDRLRALRIGANEPIEVETDEANAKFHAERVGWSWPEVIADADASTDELITEIETRLGCEIDFDGLDPELLTRLGPLARYIAERAA